MTIEVGNQELFYGKYYSGINLGEGGVGLHLFPNGNFAVTFSSGLLLGQKKLAGGRYVTLNGILSLKYDRPASVPNEIKDKFNKFYRMTGCINKVTHFEEDLRILVSPDKFGKLQSKKGGDDYFRLFVEYQDWESIERRINRGNLKSEQNGSAPSGTGQ